MIDERDVFEKSFRRYVPEGGSFERLMQRRDRKRRSQRIAAGIVGITVFVAAVWIVTSGARFDRTETAVVPGGVTGPAETGPSPAGTSAAPDVVAQRPCGVGQPGEERSRLELTDMGDRIKVRFEVLGSPVGHSWRIVLRHGRVDLGGFEHNNGQVKFEGTRVASENGDLAVQRLLRDQEGFEGGDGFAAKAVDRQTGLDCRVNATIFE